MPNVDRSILVAAPVEDTFDYVANHRNAGRWMHNVSRFEPVGSSAYGLGAQVSATASVFGIPITTMLEIVEFERPLRLVSRTTGRLRARSTWEFAPDAAGTRVRFWGEYDVPAALLRMVGGGLVQRELETNAEKSLQNLKRALEGLPA